jgi:pSer/pThr/pTyr-binding forkhead associated (FHA) protein
VVVIGLVIWRGKSRIKLSSPSPAASPKPQTPYAPPAAPQLIYTNPPPSAAVQPPQLIYPNSRASLFVVRGAGSLPSIVLSLEGLTIGRDLSNQFLLNDEQISRRHAKLEFADGFWWINDLGTANGTYVNGERIMRHPLQHNDQITLGQCILLFQAS